MIQLPRCNPSDCLQRELCSQKGLVSMHRQNSFGMGFLPPLMFGACCSNQCLSYILDYISSIVKESF